MLAIPMSLKLYLTMALTYISKDDFLVSREIIFIDFIDFLKWGENILLK